MHSADYDSTAEPEKAVSSDRPAVDDLIPALGYRDQLLVAKCKGVRCPPIFSLSNLIDAGWL